MTDATILQLYPEELGVAGDRGNVLALASRLRAAGLSPTVVEHRRGDTLVDSADAVVIGNGPISAMRTILDDLTVNGARLVEWARAGVPVFAYGSGAELLSEGIDLLDGSTIEGLGLFPFRARRVSTRSVGYVITQTDSGRVVGFEDNASVWVLDNDAKPLGRIEAGDGNGDGREGAVAGESFATQIGGPVLPLNPDLTDRLVAAVARRVGGDFTPSTVEGELEGYATRAREVITRNVAHHFSRI
ncbi:type 1 glutamine amidotransferase [Marisediminicola sp. LYQ134]|uniref:type 1 glutamine amidotransferase n=1 Tax=unclassified Marisediminicola TaxID=2618316 RepID=UPI003982E945